MHVRSAAECANSGVSRAPSQLLQKTPETHLFFESLIETERKRSDQTLEYERNRYDRSIETERNRL